ncbi:hypothetical protein HOLleu_30638 [Holothuria leucospilota]|uniref:Uncharacterized protein n=1 Tax=Holothuria leucospilota TaxID=206669 RepID=A0A9Q1BKR9_HOLLE|nr:hypothetical protein HOLleu_30638 [Holothuria leucospilota]
MMQNVCANNVESVIRSVLKHLSQISDIRLPRKTFAKCMFLEGRALAQLQCLDVLIKAAVDGEAVILGTDGTTKWGHKYGTYDASFSDGSVQVIGLREMSSGSAECTLYVLKEVILIFLNIIQRSPLPCSKNCICH